MISLQKHQVDKKTEEIKDKLLKSGRAVTAFDVTKHTGDFFKYNTPGLPYLKPLSLEPYTTSNADVINEFFFSLKEDIEDLYEVFNRQDLEMIRNYEKYDIELLRLNKDIDEVVNKVKILEEFTLKRKAYYPHIINFYDLSYVNSENDYTRNLYNSDCDFDFETSTMKNSLTSTIDSKVDLNDENITFLNNNKPLALSDDIKKIIKENNVSILNIEFEQLEKVEPEIELVIDFKEIKKISSVVLNTSSLINTKIKLSLAGDDDYFIEIEEQDGADNGINEFLFLEREVKSIRIKFKKLTYDLKADKLYKYIYSFINVSVYRNTYEMSNIYVSSPLEFKNVVSDIQLDVIKEIPPLTNIDLFVGYEDKDNIIEWIDFDVNKGLVDLKLLTKIEKDLNYSTSDAFGDVVIDKISERKYFKVHELEEDSSINSIELRAGHNQWLIEKLNENTSTDKEINLKDYNKENIKAIAPLDMTIPYIKCESTNNYFVLTGFFTSSNDVVVNNRFIEFDKDDEEFLCEVIVNGKKIFKKKDLYNFKLNKGENKINLMISLNKLTDANKLIKHNFNLLEYCTNAFAGPKMSRTNLNTLIKNVDGNSVSYFSTIMSNNKLTLITVFDVNYIKKPTDPRADDMLLINNSEYFRMHIKYKYLSAKKKERITNSDGNSNIRVRVMAKLNTLSKTITPVIKTIKVVGI